MEVDGMKIAGWSDMSFSERPKRCDGLWQRRYQSPVGLDLLYGGSIPMWPDAWLSRCGEQSPLLSPNMRRWKWIPFSPESLFPPSSLTLNNSLTCQSCFTRRRQGWIFEAKAGDEQSPPVYRPPGLYWAADGTRRPSAYCTRLSSPDRTSEPTLPPACINVNGLLRHRHGGGRERGCDAALC